MSHHYIPYVGHNTTLPETVVECTKPIILTSKLKIIGPVTFPEWTGEKVYMQSYDQVKQLPAELARWQATIDAMSASIRATWLTKDGCKAYLMIDQGEVKAKATHRRGGPHIDGNWVEDDKQTRHVTVAKTKSYIVPDAGHHLTERGCKPERVTEKGLWFPEETLILASNVAGCVAYIGDFDGRLISKGGDCSKVDLSRMIAVKLKPGIAYAGNVTMIHESIPVSKDCKRTLVRINVPGHSF